MSKNGSTEYNRAGKLNSSENTKEEVPEVCVLTQEAVNEHIKGYIASITKQLGKMTRLVQGMMTIPHPSHYPRADYSAISGAPVHQPDTVP